MRLSIDHRTLYRFEEPQARIVQLLRLTPENSHDQTVANWNINVDRDAKMRSGRDGYGNAITMLYVEGPIETLEIAITGEVVTSASEGILRGVAEALPPALFLRATELTPADATIAEFARDVATDGDRIAALHALNMAVNRRFKVDRQRPDPTLDAAAAFEMPKLTPRDQAQVFIVAARALGIPARYVSGYGLAEGARRFTPHGWAEAYVEDCGWIGFDPCTGQSPREEYVRVASALDSMGAAPVAGSRLGDGGEELDVEIVTSVQ